MAWHDEGLAPDSIHQVDFVGATDPALDAANRVAAHKRWLDTSTTPYTQKIRNAANDGWVTIFAAADYATQAALDAVEDAAIAADALLDGRVDALETAIADHESRLDTLEAASGGGIEAWAALVDGATITWDVDGKREAKGTVTLGGNRTLSITNAVNGSAGIIRVTQDGTGSRTLTLPAGSIIQGGGGTSPTLSTAAGAVDVLAFEYDGTTFLWTVGLAFA